MCSRFNIEWREDHPGQKLIARGKVWDDGSLPYTFASMRHHEDVNAGDRLLDPVILDRIIAENLFQGQLSF